ncbi:MAG: EAL domain-containing protein [Parafilimonas terrae]|nr:EAL domain-containing protein [Parafilimonas terrae]
MARVSGRNAGLWTAGLLGTVTLGPLAVFSPTWTAVAVAAAGLALAGVSQVRLSRLSTRCEKLSQEVDVLSRRLLKLEEAGTAPIAAPPPLPIETEVHELTVEIGLLSGIVQDLSAVVRSQDGEIARLRATPPQVVPSPPTRTADPTGNAAPTVIAPSSPTPPRSVEATPPMAPSPAPLRPIPPRPVASVDSPSDSAILTAFEAGQVEVYLQPVITLPQRKVVSYEALARLRIDDLALEPPQFLPALERHGRTTELDRRMLTRAGTIVRHLGRRGSDARLLYSLSPLSLFEPGFLKDIARIAGDDQTQTGLDIALPQASWRGLDSGQLGLLSALRGRVGFCLDRPTDLRFDARELAAHGIGQVKVSAGLLLRPGPGIAALSDLAVEDLAPALARARIRFVVTDVTSEADVPDLLDLNIPYAQGTAFAPPRPVRGEILTEPPQETPPPPEDDPGPERRPFRSLLRRAG